MPQIGSDEKPVTFRKAFVGKGSRFRKNMDLDKYKNNYDKIFSKPSKPVNEFESARAKSKTFSMEQD
tara:strand:+ start:665 stop:865 length:201 start_codon:yes stop_codon:yes gene_type:complete